MATETTTLQKIENAKRVITKLVTQWTAIEKRIGDNRKMRKLRVDVEQLRSENKLKASETYIGVRVIDNNINKSIPPFISYLKQSRRIGIFEPMDMRVPTDIVENLESELTRVLTYPKWEFDYMRWLDGAELHAFAWVTTVYDRKKPGGCAVNYVSPLDLLFDLGVSDIQHSRMVIERYKPSLVTLRELARQNGFKPDVYKKIADKIREKQGNNNASDRTSEEVSPVYIYKLFYKEGGYVFFAWYCPTEADEWLCDSQLFWNGVKERSQDMVIDPMSGMPTVQPKWTRVYETDYPHHLLMHQVTEDDNIAEGQGRGEVDLYIQEASCTLWSSFVNQNYKASRVMWAPKTPNADSGGVAPKQLDLHLRDGAILDRPMEPLTTPPPDPMMPRSLEMLSTQNADNLNQPAWTVNNRQDSRKTATEVQAAQQQQVMTNSVSVVMFSVGMRSVLNSAWRIVQSQALQGNIMFFPDDQGKNREDIISQSFTIKPAGDTDFIERQEMVQQMQQDWPVYQNTAAASIFLEEYTRIRYPTLSDRFIQALRQGDMKKQVISALGGMLHTAVTDSSGQLTPEWQPHQKELMQVAQTAQQVLQQP